jgi:hypothetical protein
VGTWALIPTKERIQINGSGSLTKTGRRMQVKKKNVLNRKLFSLKKKLRFKLKESILTVY